MLRDLRIERVAGRRDDQGRWSYKLVGALDKLMGDKFFAVTDEAFATWIDETRSLGSCCPSPKFPIFSPWPRAWQGHGVPGPPQQRVKLMGGSTAREGTGFKNPDRRFLGSLRRSVGETHEEEVARFVASELDGRVLGNLAHIDTLGRRHHP